MTRRFAARRHHVLSGAERIERHRRNLENLRGAHAPRVLPSAPSPKESESETKDLAGRDSVEPKGGAQ